VQQALAFAAPAPYNVGAGPYWAAAFNKFGKPAIAVTNQAGNSVSVLYGNYVGGQYDGTFGAATTYTLVTVSVTTPAPQQVVVGNLGQLGLPCLVVAAAGANRAAVLLGNSDDSFQPTPVYYPLGNFPESVALGDVNGDGNLDIIAANYGSSTVSVLLGNSDRTFQTQQTYAVSANPESVVVGDFNNDGKLDIATVNSGTNPGKVNVLLNANGTFPAAVTSDVGGNPFSLAVGDFNSDGKLDIVTSNHNGGISVLLNNGVRPFPAVAPTPISAGSAPYSVAVADFNADGQPDIALANADNGGSVGILPNSGGTFQPLQPANTFSAGASPFFIAVGDFNLDGKPDIVVPNHPNNNPGTISVLLNTTGPFSIPPANDNLSNAQVLPANVSGSVTGTNIGATHEINEPNHAGKPGTASVWYNWTAPASGGATFDTFASTFDTALAVYTGPGYGALTEIASGDNDLGANGESRVTSRVKFNALSGTTYHIAVDSGGAGTATGNITLNWSLLPPPANDNFANAQVITGPTGSATSTNAGATKETGEPNHADNPGGASIWYRWTAPSDGTFIFNTSNSRINCSASGGCPYDTLLAVYTGSSLQEISQPQNLVVKNDNENAALGLLTSRVSFLAHMGTTYQIAVDSKGSAKSDVVLSWSLAAGTNDSFANALVISGSSGSVTGNSSTYAWYRWTAPNGGAFAFTSSPGGPGNPSLLKVYQADGVTLIGSAQAQCKLFMPPFNICDNSVVFFNAESGSTYTMQVSPGGVSLSWNPSSPNDNFANAQVINGYGGTAAGNNGGATSEVGEPSHGGQTATSSVWYSWTAPIWTVPPAKKNFTFSAGAVSPCTFFSQFQNQNYGLILMEVYTGSSFVNLSSVASTCPATFDADPGTTYRIAVDSRFGTGSFGLTWKPTAAPTNDNFANSQPINGSSGSAIGTNINATKEMGEPAHAGDGSASVWYSWMAPTNGSVTFNTDGSNFDTLLAVYSGSSVSNLSQVVSNDDENSSPVVATSRVTFTATGGTIYRIAVDGKGGSGNITLSWGTPRSVSGRLTDIKGVGIANIVVTLSGSASRRRITDSQGNYSFADLVQGGDYTVTPAASLFNFDVASRSYNPLTSDVTNANFVAQTPTYSIAGRLTSVNQTGIGNIKVVLTGTNIPPDTFVPTNPDGFYQFANLTTNGDFTVTPSNPLYSFNATILPANHSYSFQTLNANIPNADFNAVVNTFTISGQVTGGGGGLAGVLVTLSGSQSGMTTTNASGNYSFPGLATGGSYTVTPSDTPQYSFTGQTVPSLQNDQTLNFQGTLRNYTISGKATLNNVGLGGVTITLNGPVGFVPRTFLTLSDGTYSFANVPAASDYTVVAAKENYSFNPSSVPVNNLSADHSDVNFPATADPKTIQFSAANYNVGEGDGTVTINVTRSGDTSGAATVDFATSDGSATQDKDYEVASGALSFAATEASKTFSVLIVDDAFVEGNETINLTLSNATGATLSAPPTATITISDNDTANSTSPAPKRFTASLNGGQETPPNNSTAKGTGLVLLNQSETSALVGLLFQNLGSAETAAHIHGAGGPGVMAPILFPLPTTNPVINFSISPTAQQVADLKAGLHYQNVHSANFANGEIRGQLGWNPTLEEKFLIRQQYLDFLSRDGDPDGYNFWVGTITPCQADAQCFHDRTIAAADAFFFEPEFQQTAGFVFRAYRAAYGNTQPFPNPDNSNPVEANKLVDYSVYVADRARVVGGANLATAQRAFATLFVSRIEFTNRYGAGLTGPQFVDAILAAMQNADGIDLTAQRQALIDQFNNAGGGNAGRGMVLYRLADDNAQSNPINNRAFIDAEYNRQFALTLYFGYLRRNPDIGGFLFWQSQINSAPIRDVPKQNALVCSFVTAAEYQFRFGPIAPRSNDECPH